MTHEWKGQHTAANNGVGKVPNAARDGRVAILLVRIDSLGDTISEQRGVVAFSEAVISVCGGCAV